MSSSGDAPEVAPTGETDGEKGWVPEEGDLDAKAQHPRNVDADAAEGAEDTVVRDKDDDAANSDDIPVKQGMGDEGWATESGAQEDKGALGQD